MSLMPCVKTSNQQALSVQIHIQSRTKRGWIQAVSIGDVIPVDHLLALDRLALEGGFRKRNMG